MQETSDREDDKKKAEEYSSTMQQAMGDAGKNRESSFFRTLFIIGLVIRTEKSAWQFDKLIHFSLPALQPSSTDTSWV